MKYVRWKLLALSLLCLLLCALACTAGAETRDYYWNAANSEAGITNEYTEDADETSPAYYGNPWGSTTIVLEEPACVYMRADNYPTEKDSHHESMEGVTLDYAAVVFSSDDSDEAPTITLTLNPGEENDTDDYVYMETGAYFLSVTGGHVHVNLDIQSVDPLADEYVWDPSAEAWSKGSMEKVVRLEHDAFVTLTLISNITEEDIAHSDESTGLYFSSSQFWLDPKSEPEAQIFHGWINPNIDTWSVELTENGAYAVRSALLPAGDYQLGMRGASCTLTVSQTTMDQVIRIGDDLSAEVHWDPMYLYCRDDGGREYLTASDTYLPVPICAENSALLRMSMTVKDSPANHLPVGLNGAPDEPHAELCNIEKGSICCCLSACDLEAGQDTLYRSGFLPADTYYMYVSGKAFDLVYSDVEMEPPVTDDDGKRYTLPTAETFFHTFDADTQVTVTIKNNVPGESVHYQAGSIDDPDVREIEPDEFDENGLYLNQFIARKGQCRKFLLSGTDCSIRVECKRLAQPAKDYIDLHVGETSPALNDHLLYQENETFAWISPDPGTATVDARGRVTLLADKPVYILGKINNENLPWYGFRVSVNILPGLSFTSAAMKVGTTKTLGLPVMEADGRYRAACTTAAFSSSNTAVAKVSSKGVITAVAPGTAIITATLHNTEDETVDDLILKATVKVSTPKLSAATAAIGKGKTVTLSVSNAAASAVTWSTSDKKIATVTSKGVVKGVKQGKATITAKAGGKTLQCVVTVETPKISATSATLLLGQTKTLKVTGTVGKVTWKTSNKAVATVTSKGVVKAVKAGKATISATVSGKTVKCVVTVSASPKLSAARLTLAKGNSSTLKVTGGSGALKWSTSSKGVATVTSKGVVKAVKAGTATITAKVGAKSVKCTVTVTAAPKLSAAKATLKMGGTKQLTVTGAGSTKVTWTSSNKNVATVTSKGLVKAVKPGTATITAAVGSAKVTCKITVSKPAPVSCSVSSLTLKKGGYAVISFECDSYYGSEAEGNYASCSIGDNRIANMDYMSVADGNSKKVYAYVVGLESGATTLRIHSVITGTDCEIPITVQ